METKRIGGVELLDGYTESVWKSLVVKAVRIGWPAGIRAATIRLTAAQVRSIVWGQVYEDIFPAVSEIGEVGQEIWRNDWEALCARDTHHGRALTQEFFDLRTLACRYCETHQQDIWARLKAAAPGASASPRVLNCVWTWLRMEPKDSGRRRSIDTRPFKGMLDDAIDGHTYEGKLLKRNATMLSGHYEQHLEISKIVQAQGWDALRTSTHTRTRPVALRPQQDSLF